MTGSVAAVLVQADGKILVGGSFQSAGGAARSGLARLNPDGSVDQAFDVGGGFFALPPSPPGAALALQPDGNVIIAGDFNSVSGKPRGRLARLFGYNPPPIAPRMGVAVMSGGQIGISLAS